MPCSLLLLLSAALLLGACDPTLQGGPDTDGGPGLKVIDAGAGDGGDGAPESAGTLVVRQRLAGGGTRFTVDAQSQTEWTALDLDADAQVEPKTDATWDIAFRRFHVISRGGVSGTGNVAVAAVPGKTLAEVDVASLPDSAFVADAPDGDDTDDVADSAFAVPNRWWGYDEKTHALSPNPVIYVVRTDLGRRRALAFRAYYDSEGSPAVLTVELGP